MRVRLVAVWCACILSGAITPVYSSSTATVDVTATVVGSCSFSATNVLTFGVIQQGYGMPVIASDPAAATLRCTDGTSYSISDNGGNTGSYSLTGPGGVKMPYSVSYTSKGIGTGVDSNLAISATISPPDYDNVVPGGYSDTLTLTVSY